MCVTKTSSYEIVLVVMFICFLQVGSRNAALQNHPTPSTPKLFTSQSLLSVYMKQVLSPRVSRIEIPTWTNTQLGQYQPSRPRDSSTDINL
jgi:hypothetical protein